MRVHLFGFKPATEGSPPEPASRVLRFLSGQPEPLDAELAAALLHEFAAQEKFRVGLLERVSKLVAAHVAQAAEIAPTLEVPFVRAESYQAGYAAARYRTLTECAQVVQTLLNELVAEGK